MCILSARGVIQWRPEAVLDFRPPLGVLPRPGGTPWPRVFQFHRALVFWSAIWADSGHIGTSSGNLSIGLPPTLILPRQKLLKREALYLSFLKGSQKLISQFQRAYQLAVLRGSVLNHKLLLGKTVALDSPPCGYSQGGACGLGNIVV